MATVDADNLEFCVDCVQAIANGEGTDAHTEAMVAIWGAGPNGVIGLVLDLPIDEDFAPWFSWSRCDGCGSTLGGDRYPGAHLVS
jgi:hypothetical protein